MLRKELNDLEKHKGNPLVSIIAPMKKTFPDIKENPIILKNQTRKVKEKLTAGYDSKKAEEILQKLEKIETGLDYDNMSNGIGIFIGEDIEKVIHLPFSPPGEKVVVDSSFQVRDLVFTHNRMVRYWVLCLSEAPTRLLEGYGSELRELHNGTFPAEYVGPEAMGQFDTRRVRREDFDQVKDDYKKKYFRKVDEAAFDRIQADNLPVVLVGVNKNINLFRGVARTDRFVVGSVEGNHVQKSEHDLAPMVWPVIEAHHKEKRDEALKNLEESIGAHKYVSGLQNVWDIAKQGSIDTLLVEQNYFTPAYVNEDKSQLAFENNGQGHLTRIEDAVDDAIEEVTRHGGKVYFLSEGRLKDHGRIAGTTRY